MARAYDRLLVDLIRKRARVIEADGLAIELRPVPDDDREHALDPRVLAATLPKLESPCADVSMRDVHAMRSRPPKPTNVIDGADIARTTTLVALPGRDIRMHLWVPSDIGECAPIVVYLHGGYFAFGSLEEREAMLRHLAWHAGCVVAYPEYRLAPECPYPAAVDDCEACIDWLAAHDEELGIDMGKLVVIGDSAGGSLANAMVMRGARTHPVALVVTMYAVIDSWPPTKESGFSYKSFACLPEQEQACRNRIDRIRFAGADLLYTAGDAEALRNPEICAWHADDVSMFPRTVVAYSEFDFLRCQNERWARRLAREGVDVRCVRYCGCDHGFIERFGTQPQAEDFVDLVVEEIERL